MHGTNVKITFNSAVV